MSTPEPPLAYQRFERLKYRPHMPPNSSIRLEDVDQNIGDKVFSELGFRNKFDRPVRHLHRHPSLDLLHWLASDGALTRALAMLDGKAGISYNDFVCFAVLSKANNPLWRDTTIDEADRLALVHMANTMEQVSGRE